VRLSKGDNDVAIVDHDTQTHDAGEKAPVLQHVVVYVEYVVYVGYPHVELQLTGVLGTQDRAWRGCQTAGRAILRRQIAAGDSYRDTGPTTTAPFLTHRPTRCYETR